MAAWPYNTETWKRLRLAKLSANPCCEVCEKRGRIVSAVAVDHVLAINAGGEAFPPLSGLMSCCLPCHSYKTNHEDRPDRRRKLGTAFKGCGVDGGPLDPSDDWNAPAARPARPVADCDGPAAPQGRPIDGDGPARESKTELVSANHSQLESDRWV